MSSNKSIWWEKTVEYAYVRKFLGDYTFLYPFDGKHEKLSDTLLSNGYSWIIVEFKQDHKWLTSEKEKFNKYGGVKNYSEACKELVGKYGSNNYSGIGHHFIVYGKLEDKGKSNLDLIAERYFSKPKDEIFKPVDLLLKGIEQSDFIKYVNRFNWFKSRRGGNGGGSGDSHDPGPTPRGFDFDNYTSVIGIGIKDNAVVCAPMKELIELTEQSVNKQDVVSLTDDYKFCTIKKRHPPKETPAEEVAD